MFVKILYQTFPNSLRVLSALSGFFLLTAEHAKIFVTVFNTKLLPIIHEIFVPFQGLFDGNLVQLLALFPAEPPPSVHPSQMTVTSYTPSSLHFLKICIPSTALLVQRSTSVYFVEHKFDRCETCFCLIRAASMPLLQILNVYRTSKDGRGINQERCFCATKTRC